MATEKLKEAVKIWKELGIDRAEFEFSCGGDSMNDTTINFYGKNNKIIHSQELTDFFDDEIYRAVEFYEASDGHYQGEAGVVHINLDSDSDDEAEHEFTYSKDATAEYNETFTEVADVELTDEQVAFIKKNISNMNGGDDSNLTINYIRDFIMTDDDERIVKEIENLIDDEARDYDFKEVSDEAERTDWYTYTTNNEHLEELTIEGNILKLEVSRTFTTYQESC